MVIENTLIVEYFVIYRDFSKIIHMESHFFLIVVKIQRSNLMEMYVRTGSFVHSVIQLTNIYHARQSVRSWGIKRNNVWSLFSNGLEFNEIDE